MALFKTTNLDDDILAICDNSYTLNVITIPQETTNKTIFARILDILLPNIIAIKTISKNNITMVLSKELNDDDDMVEIVIMS
jgi:hypothetical protein